MNHFYYLTDLGEINLPSVVEIDYIEVVNNEKIILFLDSCVCLEIINFIKQKEKAKIDKTKIFNLIEYAQKNEVKVTPIFALMELCYDRTTNKMKYDKLWKFKNIIDYAIKQPIEITKQFDFDYEVDYEPFRGKLSLPNDDEMPLIDNISQSYVGLLKIRELTSLGLKKKCAEKNISLFVDWMINDLDRFLGFEYLLALEIFGGNNKMRSMIKLDSTPEKAKKTLWGTAWDLFHARFNCDRLQLEQIVQVKPYPIFVTKDYALYKLMSLALLFNIQYEFGRLKYSEEYVYPKHFSNGCISNLNAKISNFANDRFGRKPSGNANKIKLMIRELEERLI